MGLDLLGKVCAGLAELVMNPPPQAELDATLREKAAAEESAVKSRMEFGTTRSKVARLEVSEAFSTPSCEGTPHRTKLHSANMHQTALCPTVCIILLYSLLFISSKRHSRKLIPDPPLSSDHIQTPVDISSTSCTLDPPFPSPLPFDPL